MNIVKCLLLRSSMIGVGALVGGLILAVWHFSGSSRSATDAQAAVTSEEQPATPAASQPGMIPVDDLDPDPIKPPSVALLDNDSSLAAKSTVGQGLRASSPEEEKIPVAPGAAPVQPATDFPLTDVAPEPNLESPASSPGSEFVLSDAQEPSGKPLPGSSNRGGSFEVAALPPPRPVEDGLVTDTGVPSPAHLPLPVETEVIPQLPPSTSNPVVVSPAPSTLELPGRPEATTAPNPAGTRLPGPQPTLELSAPGDLSAAPLTASPVSSLPSVDTQQILDRPGDPQFDGEQAPKLVIQKRAPAEIQVNQLATFEVKVSNVGQVPAHGVRVHDFVPRGTRLERASPAVVPTAEGGLTWNLGTLQAGQEITIAMDLMPLEEGQIGSVATVDFQAKASVRTTCTKPQLMVKQSAPEKVLIGKDITISITISNSGSGDATSLVLVEDVPEQLSHAAGRELEYPIGTLRPGETKQLALKLKANKAGQVRNVLALRGPGKIYVEDMIPIEVIAPQLQVAMVGPKVRYLERPAKYSVTVANPGTAAANNIELVAYLPKGLKFVETDHHGRYDKNHHAVLWSLEELPANVRDSVSITAMPIEAGEQRMRLEGRASLGLAHQFEHLVQVESAAQLLFRVTDLSDPIETGNETTYEIRVTNVGTRAATGIRVGAALSPALQPLSGNGPTAAAIQGQQVFFGPLERIAPRGEAIYKVTARGLQHGDHLMRVQVISNESPAPVTKEESTRVYQDQ